MTGSIIQINISNGGIPKRPISEANITPLGVEGDRWAHPAIHGGPRQALLLICAEGLDELVAQGWPLFAGALGENLTTRGLARRDIRIGQRYRAGGVILEITKLRQPCTTLDVYGKGFQQAIYDKRVKAGDFLSPLWGLGGFYASIERPGPLRQHDIISLIDQVV